MPSSAKWTQFIGYQYEPFVKCNFMLSIHNAFGKSNNINKQNFLILKIGLGCARDI